MIPTEVLVDKHKSTLPCQVEDGDGTPSYYPEIVTNVRNAWVRTILRIKDFEAKKKPKVIVYIDKRNINDFLEV